ncbi:MAG: hypothetical protein OSJ43_12285 [Oscillospiraceae bacterium]|nr:hypothetical protein [Oscillospiraceae bacterium]
MTEATMKKWQAHIFSSGSYAGDDYVTFQKSMRVDLIKQLKSAGLELKQFNKNHYCFSAVVTDGVRFAYISIGDVRYNSRIFSEVLYRTMAHEKDWRGGNNRYCRWNEVGAACKELLEREALREERVGA